MTLSYYLLAAAAPFYIVLTEQVSGRRNRDFNVEYFSEE